MNDKIKVVDANSTFGARFKFFLKSWLFSHQLILWIPYWVFPIEDSQGYFLGWGFWVSVILGFIVSCWILSITKPKPQVDPVSKRKVVGKHLVCPFCESSRLGERQVTIDRSTENAMAGYLAFGKPGLIFGAMPDEVHKFLICYDCANEFSYDEALVAQEYDAS